MLKKLKSLFIVEDENSTDSKKSDKGTATPQKGGDAPKQQPAVKVDKSIPAKGEGKPDEKFVNRLLQAIEENNIEGFDYLEYKQSLQSLDSMEMDEATMFKSSFAMAKTMGATSDKLLSSAEHYLSILKSEEQKFQDALSNQHEKVVSGTNNQLSQMEQSIQQKEQQIEQLKLEIEETKKQLAEKKSGIDSNIQKIAATKTGFYAAYHIVVDQIQADIAKMKQHLQ